MDMAYVLKRKPVWLECLPLTDSGTISILSGDGCQVHLPAALLLAVSSLAREIFTDHIPPTYSSPLMSLPDISGEVVSNFGEFLLTGGSSVNMVNIQEFQHVLEMLRIDCNLKSERKRDPSDINDAEEPESMGNEYYEVDFKIEDKTIKLEESSESSKDTEENILNTESKSESAKSPTRSTSTKSVRSLNKKCENCGKVFTTNSTLARHIDAIHRRPSFSCNWCSRIFKRSDTLSTHIDVDHKKNQKVFKCSICGKIFKHRSTLKTHGREHKRTNLLACNVCGKQFVRGDHLSRHASVHNVISDIERKKRQVACNICGKKYSSGDNLVSHIRTIHDGKRFQCYLCKKEYKAKYYLKVHMKQRHGLHQPQ